MGPLARARVIPGSRHQPFSQEGALIFVKLWQMPPSESRHVRLDTNDARLWQKQDGYETCALFPSAYEQVCLQRWLPHAVLVVGANSAELLVIAGEIVLDGQPCPRGSWLRFPVNDAPHLVAGAQGATVYHKTGHLVAGALR